MMQRKIVYVAMFTLLLGTTGCFDQVINKAKNCLQKCSACLSKNSESKSTEKLVENKVAEPEAAVSSSSSVKKVSAEEVKNGLETNDNLVIINVLAEKYYRDCHIIGSINMPLESISKEIQGIDRNAPIIIYCANASCPVSGKAIKILQRQGYTNVSEYVGGMKEWHDLGYPYEGPAEESYLKGEKK